METKVIEDRFEDIYDFAQKFTRLFSNKINVDYDIEADVLYISFDRPQRATDSIMKENGVLFRYRDDKLVGITILEASTRDKNKI